MIVEINASGTLTLRAETPLEAYALSQWWKEAGVLWHQPCSCPVTGENCMVRGSKLLIDTSVPQ